MLGVCFLDYVVFFMFFLLNKCFSGFVFFFMEVEMGVWEGLRS